MRVKSRSAVMDRSRLGATTLVRRVAPRVNGNGHYGHNGNGKRLRIVILGLSITSSWGNGHATTFRGLVRELHRLGHDVLFLERDRPWYSANRDMPRPPFGRTRIYRSGGSCGGGFHGRWSRRISLWWGRTCRRGWRWGGG